MKYVPKAEIPSLIIQYESEMNLAAEMLDFERAIQMRDLIRNLERKLKGENEEDKNEEDNKENKKTSAPDKPRKRKK